MEFDASKETIVFPKDTRGANWAGDGVVTLTAGLDVLGCRIEASEPGQRDGLKGALARHVDRFAFRETLVWVWHDV